MARSRKNLKRKRSSGSKDSGHYSKRHSSDTYLSKSQHSPSTSSNHSQQSLFHSVVTYAQIPYYSWLVYFHDQEYIENSETVLKINVIVAFFLNDPMTQYDRELGLNFDINSCIDNSILREKWPSFIKDLKTNPEHTLKCIKVAFSEVMMQRVMTEIPGNAAEEFKTLRINRINILNFGSVDPTSCVTWSSHRQLISISGSVVNTEREKFTLDSIVFVCECKHELFSKPRNNTILFPKKCDVCGNARMQLVYDSLFEMTKLSQNIDVKIKETNEQNIDEHSIRPNIITVKLTQSLVNKFMAGDKIRIIGIPRVTLGAAKASSSESNPFYIDAQSVFEEDDKSSKNSDIQINWRIIEEIKREPDILSLLVHSLCPSVQGHEIIKAALLLGLFGGTPKNNETRDFVHVFIIGNLGLGKSQLLRSCAQVASEGKYIRASSTVSLDSKIKFFRNNNREDYRFEAGSLTLTNSGFLCLDDFDAISNQHQIIYNAMKNRRIDTMNSELKFSRPFRSSIFAMSNSIKKSYDPTKTVVENVNTSKELLNQFDLIFLMRDNPNRYLDKLTCSRVLTEHKNRNSLNQLEGTSDQRISDEPRTRTDRTLREKLVASNTFESTYLLPERFLRMYINYVRIHVKPIISEASKSIITRFCLLRRQKQRERRDLEKCVQTLVNLTEARAKVDSRMETSEQDVFDAIEILENSMCIESKDSVKNHPQSNNNANKITTSKMRKFIDDLKTEALKEKKNVFSEEELLNIAGQENLSRLGFFELLGKLNEQGYLLKVSSKSYKLVFL